MDAESLGDRPTALIGPSRLTQFNTVLLNAPSYAWPTTDSQELANADWLPPLRLCNVPWEGAQARS
jgi:hypothetical protein